MTVIDEKENQGYVEQEVMAPMEMDDLEAMPLFSKTVLRQDTVAG